MQKDRMLWRTDIFNSRKYLLQFVSGLSLWFFAVSHGWILAEPQIEKIAADDMSAANVSHHAFRHSNKYAYLRGKMNIWNDLCLLNGINWFTCGVKMPTISGATSAAAA